MENGTFYSTFRTRWGWFGLCGNDRGLIRTCLPWKEKQVVEESLLENVDNPTADPGYLKPLQDFVITYFEGSYADFSRVSVCLDGFTDFQRKVLSALQKVKYGKSITYAKLAEKAGSPKAVRAIGQVMARNPLPLIVPCHRVIRKDGSLGGFSAIGGIDIKKKMLALESTILEK